MMSGMVMMLAMRDGDDAVLYIVLNSPVILSQKPTVGPPHSKLVYTIVIERGRFKNNTDSTTMKVSVSHSQSILTLFPALNSDIVILSEVLLKNKGRSPNSVSNCTKNPPYVSLGLV